MTDDQMTAALTRALHDHATEAPPMTGLVEKAMARAARRRRHRIQSSIAAIIVLAVAIPVAIVAAVDRETTTPPVAKETNPMWRWESYQGVQVQVPPDWGYGVAGASWCAARAEGENWQMRPGAVGRPGPMQAILCPSEYPPVAQRENWLTFNSRTKSAVRPIDNRWVEQTREVNGVFVTIFSNDAALRTAILDSAQPITDSDHYGCPSINPATMDPHRYRPRAGLPLPDAVRSIAVCRYTLKPAAAPLLSSGRLDGAAAQDVVAAIRAAPEGSGPNEPNAPPDSIGSEIVVLLVSTDEGPRQVVVRYSGQTDNGFDDGNTLRQLTADAIRPLLTGANRPTEFSMAVAGLLGG